MTDTTTIAPDVFAGLPDEPLALCGVARGLMVHEFLLDHYGVDYPPDRRDEIEQRSFVDLATTILQRSNQPLVAARPPSDRSIGNCRHYSVITTALLRRQGHPARARGGFANYFDPTMWMDHWIIERWNPATETWVRSDTQIDDVQTRLLGIDFNPLHLPHGRFLTGAEAWTRCRNGGADPDHFGIGEHHGEWFIAGSLIRDLAALNKTEPHTWDLWGTISNLAFRTLTDPERRHLDELAATVLADQRSDLLAAHNVRGIQPRPPITSNRTGQHVAYPTQPESTQ